MFSTQFLRRSTLKAVCAAVLVSSLALGGQAGAWPNGCERIITYEVSSITIYGVDFPILVKHVTVHCS